MVKVLSHINAFGLVKGEVGEVKEVDGMEGYFKAGLLERLDDAEVEKSDPVDDYLDDEDEG